MRANPVRLSIALLIAISLGGYIATVRAQTSPPIPAARIVALTDLHGALEEETLLTADQKPVRSGGAAWISAYVQRLRAQAKGPTFIFDAGDLFQGTLVSNTAEGRPVVDFYNALGMDAVVIGNHDFDYGPTGPNVVVKTPSDDPRGALKDRIAQAHFPFLAANIEYADGRGQPDWAQPSKIIERDGVRVGVIGIAAVGTPETTLRANVADLRFVNPTAPIVREALRLRRDGAHFVVVLTHTGGECKDNSAAQQRDTKSCLPSELFELIDALPRGTVDLVLGGHTHKGVAKFYKDVPVLQPYSNSRAVAWVDLSKSAPAQISGPISTCGDTVATPAGPSCDPKTVQASRALPQPAELFGEKLTADEKMTALLQADFDRVSAIKKTPLGVSTTATFEKSYFDENAVGNALADAYYQYLAQKSEPVDAVLMNNGGLRFILPKGELTYGDLFTVLPFDNRLATMRVDGQTFLRMMELGVSRKQGGISWSGVTFEADHCKVLRAQVGNQPLEAKKMYKILAPDFIATGGSGIDQLHIPADQIEVWEDRPVMRDIMVDALKALPSPLAPETYFDPKAPRQKIRNLCN